MEKTEKSAKSSRNRSILNTVLLVFILIIVVGGGGYYAGFQMGKKQGAKALISQATDLLNPLKAISSNPAFPYTIIGKVTAVSEKEVSVKVPDGTVKKIALNDKTTVSTPKAVVKLSDIKKDSSVTVFTSGKGEDVVANRVIIR